jgi:hypothetical protein
MHVLRMFPGKGCSNQTCEGDDVIAVMCGFMGVFNVCVCVSVCVCGLLLRCPAFSQFLPARLGPHLQFLPGQVNP